MSAKLKKIENDLLQAYNSLVQMRTNPDRTKENVQAIASMVADIHYDLNRHVIKMRRK